MAYPQGFLFPPPTASVSLALSSCPTVLLGPRAGHEGSAFAPYSSSSSSNPHLPYGGEPRAAAAISSFLSPAYDPPSSLDYHPFGPLGPYPYGDPAYRKNATRDATATLKAWLSEHRKNPYPTKGEKIMLAIITKMTLTQVSTWFANARRRLKKENKMTWTPRNRSEDEEEEDIDPEGHEEYEQPLKTASEPDKNQTAAPRPASDGTPCSLLYRDDPAGPTSTDCTPVCSPDCTEPQRHPLVPRPSSADGTPPPPAPPLLPLPPLHPHSPDATPPKPKLWSLAEIATSSDKHKGSSGDSSQSAGPRTPFPHGTPLHRPLYYAPPFLPGYNYSTLGAVHGGPGLALNGLQQTVFNRADFRLRTLGHSDEFKKGTTSS